MLHKRKRKRLLNYLDDRIRLLIGNLIVFTIQKGIIWLALDKELLNDLEEARTKLENSRNWKWDNEDYPEYSKIPSKNGYYNPSEDHSKISSIISEFHFEFIEKVSKKYEKLNKKSQLKYTPELLYYLEAVFEEDIPKPGYDSFSPSNPIQEIEDYRESYNTLSETERETVVQSRVGQGRFRSKLIKYWRECAVSSCQPIEILNSSHIKPWRDSNNKERLDVYNGLLLIPNLDSLFDKGLITFDGNGNIIISDLLEKSDREKLGIKSKMRLKKIEEPHKKYLAYHRQNVFEQK
ncbi:MAG: hypothetical protein GF353_10580 [Candidatus Lokiarchaeota archaeon]|nr:hypothetical protein [Candidatus Lokiarchaeota archaeon]